jgi:hypothetical protein
VSYLDRTLPVIRPDRRIPVPPFSDRSESMAFHRALAEHVAELGRASGGPHPETLALCAAISEAAAAVPDDRLRHPSPLALSTALRVFLPVPWTPVTLVRTVGEVLPARGMTWAPATPTHVSYFSDPEFSASRAADGSWTARFRERGISRVDAVLADDQAFVVYLMDHVTDAFPYPYAHSLSPRTAEQSARARANAEAVVGAFRHERDLPYLQKWTAAGEQPVG